MKQFKAISERMDNGHQAVIYGYSQVIVQQWAEKEAAKGFEAELYELTEELIGRFRVPQKKEEGK